MMSKKSLGKNQENLYAVVFTTTVIIVNAFPVLEAILGTLILYINNFSLTFENEWINPMTDEKHKRIEMK
jgi:hypothetical protein